MSDDSAKSPADHLTDTLAEIKEMRHYSKFSVEHLTASWILFEGELKELEQSAGIEELMNRQSEFHDALESTIDALETRLKGLNEEASDAWKRFFTANRSGSLPVTAVSVTSSQVRSDLRDRAMSDLLD
jgi:hypothetical protein